VHVILAKILCIAPILLHAAEGMFLLRFHSMKCWELMIFVCWEIGKLWFIKLDFSLGFEALMLAHCCFF
jgi:hypothetical protein